MVTRQQMSAAIVATVSLCGAIGVTISQGAGTAQHAQAAVPAPVSAPEVAPDPDNADLVPGHTSPSASATASTSGSASSSGLPSQATIGKIASATASASSTPIVVSNVPVPDILAKAYQKAAAGAPCKISVSLLAAIGQVESGSLEGVRITTTNRVQPAIYGPVLDGNGFAAIPDTDHGKLDGNTTWDRAVGPMQFIPSTWALIGRDGDGDGLADPQDVYDSTLTAATYLCEASGGDLTSDAGLRQGILAYNHSTDYLNLVLAWKKHFETGLPVKVEPQVTPTASSSASSSATPSASSTASASHATPAASPSSSKAKSRTSHPSLPSKPAKPASSPTKSSSAPTGSNPTGSASTSSTSTSSASTSPAQPSTSGTGKSTHPSTTPSGTCSAAPSKTAPQPTRGSTPTAPSPAPSAQTCSK